VNGPLILELVGLRYKLLWAKTRSRNGRIARFITGYLLFFMVIGLLGLGGFGAALAAVNQGKALVITRAVLMSLFLQAVISTNILGFGMSRIFSEFELRRYPLTAADRRIARHLTGILDPFWFLFFALELGLALGLFGLGAADFSSAVLAALLLFVCNYLCARVVATMVELLVKRKGGAAILLGVVMVAGFLPLILQPVLHNRPKLAGAIVERLAFTPPFAAASAMVAGSGATLRGFALLLVWIAALAGALIWLEKRPSERRAAVSNKFTWDSPFDRAGALFGPVEGPFVAHWLRFYIRNPRTRTLMMLAIPLIGFLTYSTSSTMGRGGLFVVGLGTISAVTFLGTSRIALNQFGYSGGAFRRYFLLPVSPGITLRAASYAAVMLGGSALPIALVLWVVFVPIPFDARRVAMLLASGLTGLFLFNAAGVWVTLFNPRKGNYDSNFGNDLSLGGNVVLIGCMICALSLPRILHRFYPAAVGPEAWLVYLVLPVLAVLIYRFSLRLAGPVFTAWRERILAVIEGRS
jgi:hypothetical protein